MHLVPPSIPAKWGDLCLEDALLECLSGKLTAKMFLVYSFFFISFSVSMLK